MWSNTQTDSSDDRSARSAISITSSGSANAPEFGRWIPYFMMQCSSSARFDDLNGITVAQHIEEGTEWICAT
ncbi:unannotated protein [freshwater metagenome]|uniref:Unannotated protein n=1 Tax=freshwater metagenome TaxID=449393 RepID=A0A6J6DSS7_9ZZZZ